MSGPSQENVDIASELLKVVQNLTGELDKLAQKSRSVSGQISSDLTTSLQEVQQSAENTTQSQRDLSESMQRSTESSQSFRESLGLQAEVSRDVTKSQDEQRDSSGNLIKKVTALTIAASALREGWEATVGVFNMAKNATTGLWSLFEGGVGLVTGFFGALFKMGAAYKNKANGEYFEANQAIIESFGDLRTNEGAFVKEMASDLMDAQNDLNAAGKSIFSTIGNGAAVLKEATALAQGFGNSLTSLMGQIKGATDEMFLMSKGMGMTSDSLKQIAKNAQMTGGSFEDSMQTMMVASAHLSKKFGVSVKVIGKNLDAISKDFENFGHLGETSMVAVATYAAKLGVEISALQGVMDKFDSFEGAAEAAGKLNEAFGMNIDTMKMMNEENPAARMDMLRQSLQETGKSFEDLSRHEKKLMAQTMGMDMGSLQAAMSIDPDEMGFDDVSEAAEEAADKMSPEDAMMEVSKSIKELQHSLRQIADGPLQNFINGFKYAIETSPKFRELMSITGNFLKVFRDMGEAVGKTFLEKFEKPLERVLEYFRELFSVKRITEFKNKIVKAFGDFFEAIQDPKKDMAEVGRNLMQNLWEAVQGWFQSGPGTDGLADELKMWIARGIKGLGGAMSYIIEQAAIWIRDLTKQFSESLKKDKNVQENMTQGIGGALVESLGMIWDTFRTELWPALSELMWALFSEYKWEIAGILGVVFGFIIVKAVIAGLVTAGVSELLKSGISGFADNIKGMLSNLGFGGGDAEEEVEGAEEASNQLKTITEQIGELDKPTIQKASGNMWSLVPFMAAALVMVAALGALAWGFQQAGVEIPMLLAVMGALVVVTYSIKTLLEVSKQIEWKDIGKAAVVMLAAAGLLAAVAYFLPEVLKKFLTDLDGVDTGSVLKAMFVTTVVLGSMLLVVGAALALSKLVGTPVQFLAAIAIIATAVILFYALVNLEFGFAIKEFARQLEGFDGPKFALNMTMLMIGLTALTAAMVVLIAFSVVAGVAWGAMSLLYGSGAINKPGEGKLMGIPGIIKYMGEGFKDALSWLDQSTAMKMVFSAGMFVIVLGAIWGMVKIFESMGGKTLGILAGVAVLGAIAYYFGDPKKKPGEDGSGVLGSIKQLVAGFESINIGNIGILQQKIGVIREITEIMVNLGEFIVKAGGLAAGILASGVLTEDKQKEGITGVLGDMANFLPQLATAIDKVGTTLVQMALNIQAMTKGKNIEGEMQMVLGMIEVLLQFGQGLMKPYEGISANAGFWKTLAGGSAAQEMANMTDGVGKMILKLRVHVPPMIKNLFAIFDTMNEPIETIYAKALSLEAVFNGILAVANAMKILYEMSKQEKWFGKKGVEKLNEVMATMAAAMGVGQEKNYLKVMFNAFYDTFYGKDPAKFTVNQKIKNLVRDTLSNIKVVGTFLKKIVWEDMILHNDIGRVMEDIHTEWMYMSDGYFLPSQVLSLVLQDAADIKDVLSEFYVDLGDAESKILSYTSFFNKLPDLFNAYDNIMHAGSLPSGILTRIGAEAQEMIMALNDIEADLGEVKLNPVTKALLSGADSKEFIIKTETMNLNIKMNVQMEAKKIAQAIVECTPNEKGYFSRTKEAQSDFASWENKAGI